MRFLISDTRASSYFPMSALRRSASRQRLRRWHQRAGGVPPERVTAHSEVTPVRSRPVGSNRLGGSVSCIVTPKPKVKFKFSAVLAAMAALRGSAPGWCTMRRVPRCARHFDRQGQSRPVIKISRALWMMNAGFTRDGRGCACVAHRRAATLVK